VNALAVLFASSAAFASSTGKNPNLALTSTERSMVVAFAAEEGVQAFWIAARVASSKPKDRRASRSRSPSRTAVEELREEATGVAAAEGMGSEGIESVIEAEEEVGRRGARGVVLARGASRGRLVEEERLPFG
jgi:hypothetical protein